MIIQIVYNTEENMKVGRIVVGHVSVHPKRTLATPYFNTTVTMT